MDLYKETLQLIKESPRSLADQAKVHGVSLRWIHSMKSGELDPGYFKLKAFNAALKKEHRARIRQLLKGQTKSRPASGGGNNARSGGRP